MMGKMYSSEEMLKIADMITFTSAIRIAYDQFQFAVEETAFAESVDFAEDFIAIQDALTSIFDKVEKSDIYNLVEEADSEDEEADNV